MVGNSFCKYLSTIQQLLVYFINRVPFLSYLFFLAFLTMSFVLGATKGNTSDYSEALDGFRLFCEIVVLLMIIADILLEIRDYWTN